MNTMASVQTPTGEAVKVKDSMLYLGSLLCADGCVANELGRRLVLGRSDFQTLQRVWAHASLPAAKKVCSFDACVVSKLMYSLQSACSNKSNSRSNLSILLYSRIRLHVCLINVSLTCCVLLAGAFTSVLWLLSLGAESQPDGGPKHLMYSDKWKYM